MRHRLRSRYGRAAMLPGMAEWAARQASRPVEAARASLPKIEASSYERYNGGARVKRQYGSSTVTRFYVHFVGEGADTWEKIEGYGKTSGERKTFAINEFLRKRGLGGGHPAAPMSGGVYTKVW